LPKPGKTAGSRQRIVLRGRKAVLHKPHPEPTMKKGSVESVRDFLQNAGVTLGRRDVSVNKSAEVQGLLCTDRI
jgi:hypothetical protein